jgi:hypothetical protein
VIRRPYATDYEAAPRHGRVTPFRIIGDLLLVQLAGSWSVFGWRQILCVWLACFLCHACGLDNDELSSTSCARRDNSSQGRDTPKPNARAVDFERVAVDDAGLADQVGGHCWTVDGQRSGEAENASLTNAKSALRGGQMRHLCCICDHRMIGNGMLPLTFKKKNFSPRLALS